MGIFFRFFIAKFYCEVISQVAFQLCNLLTVPLDGWYHFPEQRLLCLLKKILPIKCHHGTWHTVNTELTPIIDNEKNNKYYSQIL